MSTSVQSEPVCTRTFRLGVRVGAFAMMALIGLGTFARAGWFVGELALSASLHLGVGLLVAAVLLRRMGRVTEAGAAAIVGGVAIYPWVLDAGRARAAAPAAVRPADALVVLAANTYPGNPHVGALFEAIDGQGAHLIVLPEPSAALVRRLTGAGYTAWLDLADGSKFGLAVVAAPDPRLRVRTATVVWLGGRSPLARLEIEWMGRAATFFGVHPPAPTSQAQMDVRQRHLAFLHAKAATATVGVIAAGDFNTAFVSPAWARLVDRLRRPAGWSPATWPAELGPLGLAIDHVLVSEGWAAGPETPVALVQSDHRGIRVAVHPPRPDATSAGFARTGPP